MSTGAEGSAENRPVRVRRAFRRTAIALFAILLPIAAHTLWDYIEVGRLGREIESIRDKGEPVIEREAAGGYQPLPPSEEREAGSYYLAAAMLALGTRPHPVVAPVREWLAGMAPGRRSIQEVVDPLRQLVDRSRDALALADTAAGLRFAGFPAGTEYAYRTAGLGSLSELVSARTLSLSMAGQADRAVDSAISGLRIRRALRDAHGFSLGADHQVAGILSLSQPSPEALLRLQVELDGEDRPEQPLEDFLRARARYLEMIWRRYYGTDPRMARQYTLPMRSLTETAMRPWFTHQAVKALQVWAELIDVARTPWPQKAQASAAVVEKYQDSQTRPTTRFFGSFTGRPLVLFLQAVQADPLIIDRSSRAAVAVERFRRDHGGALPDRVSELVPKYLSNVPVDPFSGRPLLYRPRTDTYTIYSVGSNQKDDGADLTSEPQRAIQLGAGQQVVRGHDVGVRVLIQR